MTTAALTSLTAAAPAPRLVPATGTVAVVGLGYVGLPTSLALCAAGRRVIGIDIDARRIEEIRSGDPDLTPGDRTRLLELRDAEDALRMTTSAAELGAADAVLICVPTPVDADHQPDLRALRGACDTVVRHARPGQTIVLTSTSYVGTTRELLVAPLAERGLHAGAEVHVAFAPERIDPGNVVHGQEQTPRVVGGVTRACANAAALVLGEVAPKVAVVSSPEAAELTKLYENTFRAVNIALAFELAQIAGSHGIDTAEVTDAAATKPYGYMPFYPGPGVGGHCIPCDPHYLLAGLDERGVDATIIRNAMTAIADRPGAVVARTAEELAVAGRDLAGARVLVVGVTYKPGVRDVREAPALEIIELLHEHGAAVGFHDPLVPTVRLRDGLSLLSTDAPHAQDWDIAVLATRHPGQDLAWLDDVECVLDCTYRHEHGKRPARL
jgi:nucleotide sugar dehydrogenase